MKRVMFLVAVFAVSAVAIQAVLTVTSPFGSAEARSPTTTDDPDIASVLDGMEPGTAVTRQKDGSLSFMGKLTPTKNAEALEAAAREAAGPRVVQCQPSRGRISCTPIADDAVRPALNRGEEVYYRAYYRGISAETIIKRTPLLEASELVCDEGLPLTCDRADTVAPVIEAGETILITYRLFHTQRLDDGTVTVGLGVPVIPLTLAG